jgi:vacuolar-type H+-ATPase subunit I/STV1
MGNRREYIDKLAARLKELDGEINKLEKITDKAVEDMKAEYHLQIEDLFLKKAKVQDQVDKLQKASGNAWEDMKAGAELSWEVFEDSVKNNLKKKR